MGGRVRYLKGIMCFPVIWNKNDDGIFKPCAITPFSNKHPSNFSHLDVSIDSARRIDSFQKTFWSKGFDSVALHGDKQQLLAGSCVFLEGGELLFLSIYISTYIWDSSTNTSFFWGHIFATKTKQHCYNVGKNRPFRFLTFFQPQKSTEWDEWSTDRSSRLADIYVRIHKKIGEMK